MEDEMRIEFIDGQPWYVSGDWRHPFVGGGEGEAQPSTLEAARGEAGAAAQQQVADSAAAQAAGEGTQQGTQAPPETFSREYVEELRRENAERRTALKEYEEAYSAYSPQEKSALLDIARQLADPSTQPAVAKRLQAIADGILKGSADGKPTRPTGEEDPDQRPMTRAEWKAEQARLNEEQKQAQAIREIEDEARSLGIEPGSLEYAELLYIAQDPEVAGVLSKAHEKLEAHYAAKAKARAEALAAKGERWPGVPGLNTGGTGAADAEGGPPKTWGDARKGAIAYLRARAGATQ